MKKIKLTAAAVKKLAGYAREITSYDNDSYYYNVGIWADGTVSRGDLHIGGNSWTNWHDEPAISFCLSAIYTTDYAQGAERENGVDWTDDVADAWAQESNGAADSWAQQIADDLADGVGDDWAAPRPSIEW